MKGYKMPSVFRVNTDLSTGHGCFGPTLCLNGSLNVFVNGRAVARKTDNYGIAHSCGDNTHSTRIAATGSSKVFVNNKPIHRTGDSISCGDFAGQGSPSVFSN